MALCSTTICESEMLQTSCMQKFKFCFSFAWRSNIKLHCTGVTFYLLFFIYVYIYNTHFRKLISKSQFYSNE